MPISSLVSTCFDGSKAYVYLWLSKRHRVLYVGQTYGGQGTLGRAAQHVCRDGSLRLRFEAEVGLPLERADDLVLISFTLPQDQKYLSSASTYRESVEYLVQAELWDARAECSPPFTIISKIRTSPRASEPAVRRIAEGIVADFVRLYDNVPDGRRRE